MEQILNCLNIAQIIKELFSSFFSNAQKKQETLQGWTVMKICMLLNKLCDMYKKRIYRSLYVV
jgi:hypothetical protein